nr:non-specific lipid-transfer protein-like protein At5g64080 [Ipomoea batatas]
MLARYDSGDNGVLSGADDEKEPVVDSVSLPSSSPLSMKSTTRFTSDSLTGFMRNSLAPSSRQLSVRAKIFSDDITTTGICLNADEPLIFLRSSYPVIPGIE